MLKLSAHYGALTGLDAKTIVSAMLTKTNHLICTLFKA